MLQLLTNAFLYDPAEVGLRHLLVASGKVVWVGEQIPALDDALDVTVTDLDGQVVFPGFVDGHAHTTGGGGEAGYASRVPAVGLSKFVCNGVTTVVGLLGTDDTTRDTKQLLAVTRSLQAEGMTAYCYTGGYRVPPVTFTGDIRSDIVNLEPVIGVGEVAISDHRSSQPTLEELLRIASDAHVAGLMTGKAGILHLHLGDGARGLAMVRDAIAGTELPARVFNPTHCNRNTTLFGEALDLARLGCVIDLTAFPVADDEDAYSAAEGLLRFLDEDIPTHRITISSDGGGCLPHFDTNGEITMMDIGEPDSLMETLQELLAAGADLQDVLPAFTSNPARLLRLQAKGRLVAGADADLIVIDKDRTINSVMAMGEWHLRDGHQLRKGTFE